jgi:hypothetical protein
MTDLPHPNERSWRRPWLAVIAGIVAHLGVSTLMVYAVVIGGDLLSAFTDSHRLEWIHRMDDTNSLGWFVLQSISLLSGIAAGLVAVLLSPRGSRTSIATLLLFSVATVFFAQLPSPRSALIIAIWSLTTPLGLIVGAVLAQRSLREV